MERENEAPAERVFPARWTKLSSGAFHNYRVGLRGLSWQQNEGRRMSNSNILILLPGRNANVPAEGNRTGERGSGRASLSSRMDQIVIEAFHKYRQHARRPRRPPWAQLAAE